MKDRTTGVISLISTTTAGVTGPFDSAWATISADGRYIAFTSSSSLLPNENNGPDVYVRDRLSGAITRASVSSNGTEGNNSAHRSTISPNGRYVAFGSHASNLVAGASGFKIYVHDRQTGLTTCVSRSSEGTFGDFYETGNHEQEVMPAFSQDGRYVVYRSNSTNLVPGDTNGAEDVFVHDQQTGVTTRVSVSSSGAQANGISGGGTISYDGRYVGFISDASNLVPGDTNGVQDAFVHDMLTGATTRVSVSTEGVQGNGDSQASIVSGNGRFVGITSSSSNLDSRDPDGFYDVYMHDRLTGQTVLISMSSEGVKGDDNSYCEFVGNDGKSGCFFSHANNLVSGIGGRNVYFFEIKNDDFSLMLNKSVIAGQNSVRGSITLAEASSLDVILSTSSASPLVTTPTNVAVVSGELTRSFRITVTPVMSPTTVTIFAARGALVKSQPLILVPLVPTALAFTPRHVTGGQSISGRVVINGVAGPNGLVLNLSDNSNFVTTPPTATVPPGGTQAVFTMTTATVTSYKYVIVTAQAATGTKTGMFRLNP